MTQKAPSKRPLFKRAVAAELRPGTTSSLRKLARFLRRLPSKSVEVKERRKPLYLHAAARRRAMQ